MEQLYGFYFCVGLISVSVDLWLCMCCCTVIENLCVANDDVFIVWCYIKLATVPGNSVLLGTIGIDINLHNPIMIMKTYLSVNQAYFRTLLVFLFLWRYCYTLLQINTLKKKVLTHIRGHSFNSSNGNIIITDLSGILRLIPHFPP